MAPKSSPSSWSSELFGPKILTKPGTSGVPTSSALGSKRLVALYFSASWCPPCKAFSPQLAKFYNANKDDLEVIFVSSDRDDKSFSEYFAKMPWLAMVPGYSSKDASKRQAKLANMFQIQGIPTVIVLDAKTGHYITDDGRSDVMKAGNSDASQKALVQSWIEKEAVPIDQAVFGGGASSSILMRIFMHIAKNPAYIFGILYFVKQFLRYLEQLGKDDEIEGQKDL